MDTSSLKTCLSGWRELVILADSVLGWDKDWYPAIPVGLLTFNFLFVWYWDPTLLTLLAVTGLFLTLADYVGPKIMAQVIVNKIFEH